MVLVRLKREVIGEFRHPTPELDDIAKEQIRLAIEAGKGVKQARKEAIADMEPRLPSMVIPKGTVVDAKWSKTTRASFQNPWLQFVTDEGIFGSVLKSDTEPVERGGR